MAKKNKGKVCKQCGMPLPDTAEVLYGGLCPVCSWDSPDGSDSTPKCKVCHEIEVSIPGQTCIACSFDA